MPTKKDIRQLLKKGLTGMEAARLVIQDSVEVDHGREGFLSHADIQQIKSALRTQTDIEEYNRWIHVYRLVDYTLKDAKIFSLEACNYLATAISTLHEYHLEHRIRGILAFGLPALVTQKQYDELKAKQRERKLAELWSLRTLLDHCGRGLFPELEKEAAEPDEEDYLYDFDEFLRLKYPHLYRQTLDLVIQAIRDGKLRPVALPEEAIAEWEALEAEKDKLRERSDPEDLPSVNVWVGIGEREYAILQAGYQEAKDGQDTAALLAALESLREGALPEAEGDRLLDYTYIVAAQFAGLGLPNEYLDRYIPGLDDETSARPAGPVQAERVAIVQDTDPDDLDERGYYQDKALEALSRLSRYDLLEQQPEGAAVTSTPDALKKLQQAASESIKLFLAIQAIIETVSEILGVKLTQDLEQWYEQIQTSLDYYNILATPVPVETDAFGRSEVDPPYYLGLPKLPNLKIGRLKPTAKSIRYFRERMAIALGEDWWSEAIRSLDFQADDQDSLAARMADDLTAIRKEREGKGG